MADVKSYRIHDVQGNLYGPADANTLRQWVSQGRIVAGMSIAEEGTTEWYEVSTHPAVADLFGRTASLAPAADALVQGPAAGADPGVNARPELMNYASAGGQQLNVLALISMVTGILGLPLSVQVGCCGCGFIGFPLDVTAIVTGILALHQLRTTADRYTGKALALTGLICGGIGLLIFIGGSVIYFIVMIVSSARGHV